MHLPGCDLGGGGGGGGGGQVWVYARVCRGVGMQGVGMWRCGDVEVWGCGGVGWFMGVVCGCGCVREREEMK